jgi:uncharacterized membrane protein
MNKKQFMQELKDNLIGLSEDDRKEIIEDYEEHFELGKKNKRKESKIAKSLGNPKEIAKEAMEELTDYGGKITLGSAFRNLWIEVEKTSRRVWKNFQKEIPKAEKKVKELFEESKEKAKTSKKKSKGSKRSAWKIILLIMLNLFIMFWIMFLFYMVIFSLWISGISIIISGLAAVVASIFVIINPVSVTLRQLGIAGIFGGIAVTCIGFLWTVITSKLGKGLSWLVKKYMKATNGWTKR